ncbi:MAG TPA: hypothetical protein ENF16_03450 [Bacteroidetes bacterium]|nr:hypothetical protein [Bacteroidota bacterium]
MAVEDNLPVEVEVFGVTYERFALAKLFQRLQRKYQFKTVLEMPASGAKAMPSLYSLGFALAGCDVTLVDADEEGLKIWRGLNLEGKLTSITAEEVPDAIANGRRWDLCWNFAELPTAPDPAAMIRQMVSSSRWVMVVNINRFNVGSYMHRTVHKLWKVPWTHGDLRYFSPFQTAGFFRRLGLKDVRWGVVDCPPWPDSPGFRDLRLHRLGNHPHRWISPYAENLAAGKLPIWLKVVYWGERLPLPVVLKLPYSHLYYAIARVDHEAGI